MEKKLCYLDLETSISNRGEDAIGNFQASPYHPDNEIVWTGFMFEGEEEPSTYSKNLFNENPIEPNPEYIAVLIAQNISFDLSYLLTKGYQQDNWWEWLKTGKIWDVMVVEYLLTGQAEQYVDLDTLATKYGGVVKDSRIKEYWKAGVETIDIPEDEIRPYLEGDVTNLKIIFEAQLDEADRLGMLPLIQSQMEARLATIVAEVNGMAFDIKEARRQARILDKKLTTVEEELVQLMAYRLGVETHECNPGSSKQLSAMLFGGTIEVVRDMPVLDENGKEVRYKSGKRKGEVKTKKTKIPVHITGTFESKKPAGKSGYFPVGEDVIARLPNTGDDFATNLKLYRELKKQLSTYFDGYAALMFPDGCLHGTINHCATVTGRLSSSNPNLQNISNKESKHD